MKKSITFVDGDDWQGLYIGGKLLMENHQLGVVEILNAIGVKYDYIVPDDEWLAQHGSLPEKLSEVKKNEE